MRVVMIGLLLGTAACRPASYGKDIEVVVPTSSPSDGPDATPPGPRGRVLFPAEGVEVRVPHDEVTPRGVHKSTAS